MPPGPKAAMPAAAKAAGGAGSSAPSFFFVKVTRNCALPGSTDMFMLRWKDMEVRMAMCYNHAVNERSKKTNRYFSI